MKIILRQHRKTLAAILVLTVLTLAFMGPRLYSAQFGLLDDAVSIMVSKRYVTFPLRAFNIDPNTGRFFPGYLLFISFTFQMMSLDPRRLFLINWLLLLGSTLGVFSFLRWRGGTHLQAFLAAVFFCFSAPAVESFYTLSKPEPAVVLWMMAGLIGIIFISQASNKYLRYLLYLCACVSFFLAFLTKETAIVLPGIVLAWLLSARFLRQSNQDQMNLPATTRLAALVWTAGVISLALYLAISHKFALDGAYTSNYQVTARSISAQAGRWFAQIIRDYCYLLPLSLLLLSKRIRLIANRRLLVDSLAWATAWIMIFLPWPTLKFYYMLPFAVGAAWFAGSLAGAGIQALSASERPAKLWASGCLACALVLSPVTLVNMTTMGVTQITYDEINHEMIERLGEIGPNDTIYINTPVEEYFIETQLHLKRLYQRPSDSVVAFSYQLPRGNQPVSYNGASPVVENIPIPGVRNSLENEARVKQWNICLGAFLNNQVPVRDEITQNVQWYDIDLNRFLHNRWGFPDYIGRNDQTPTVASAEMLYGWRFYQFSLDPQQAAHEGIFNQGNWILKTPQGERSIAGFGRAGDTPISGDFDGDGWTDVGVFRPSTRVFFLDTNLDGKTELELQISGMAGDDLPLVGDWDGDGTDTLGYYRRSDQSWNFVNRNRSGEVTIRSVIANMPPSAIPLSGDWNGDGLDTFGMYLPESGDFRFVNDLHSENSFTDERGYRGPAGSIPVVADWYSLGQETVAYMQDGKWVVWPHNIGCDFANPLIPFDFGQPGDLPVAGVWRFR